MSQWIFTTNPTFRLHLPLLPFFSRLTRHLLVQFYIYGRPPPNRCFFLAFQLLIVNLECNHYTLKLLEC
jgi:hypothetical protein